jgi:hypothetical protein
VKVPVTWGREADGDAIVGPDPTTTAAATAAVAITVIRLAVAVTRAAVSVIT